MFKYKKDQWVSLFFTEAAWTDEKGKTLHHLYYNIKYYPKSHSVTLDAKGHRAREHGIYTNRVMPYLNWAKHMVMFYNRKKVLGFIEKVIDPSGRVDWDGSVPAKKKDLTNLTIEELEEEIKKCIEEERYLEANKYQEILDKKLKSEN